MTDGGEAETLEDQVLRGDNPKLQRLAADGVLPLPPERLIPLQIRLRSAEDSSVADAAASALEDIDPRILAPVLAREGDPETLRYFAAHSEHPLVLETIVRSRRVTGQTLEELARRVPGDVQEVLILRQDVILERPAILDALEANPELRPPVRRRVQEYRTHLIARPKPRRSESPSSEEDEEEEIHATPEEIDEAIEQAASEPIVGEIDEDTGLSEGQIRTLPVPVRLQLSRGAGKTLRDILIRDANPQVALSVLKFNTFSDGEIERIAKMRTVVEDVLEGIGRSRRWMRRYPIVLALVKNPRTPIPIGVGLVPRLAVRDLKLLRRDRNISEAVRTRANRLFLTKMQ